MSDTTSIEWCGTYTVEETVKAIKDGKDGVLVCVDGGVTVEQVRLIGTEVAESTTLRGLNLNNNQIGAEGAKYLSDALNVNGTLLNLYLANNQVSKERMDEIKSWLNDEAKIQERKQNAQTMKASRNIKAIR